MTARAGKLLFSTLFATLALALLGPSVAAAASNPGPAWKLGIDAIPSNLSATAVKNPTLNFLATNVGEAGTAGPFRLTTTLPAGIEPVEVTVEHDSQVPFAGDCHVAVQAVECEGDESIAPGRQILVRVYVTVAPDASGDATIAGSVEGGGALPAQASTEVPIGPDPVGFGFAPGAFDAPLFNPDGSPATTAGGHPSRFLVDVDFPSRETVGGALIASGHARNVFTELPRGLIVDPAASPVLCTEAELFQENGGGKTSVPSCPPASQVGTITVLANLVGGLAETTPLYNMVPPPGWAASLGAEPVSGVSVYLHFRGGVRSDGDYGITSVVENTPAFGINPVYAVQVQLWGSPVPGGETALLTSPTECSGSPLPYALRADSWEEQGVFKEATYESADLEGNPVTVSGCNELPFEPTVTAQPTTNLADSPSGLDVDLHQPQDQRLGHRAPAALKDATVTLPEGMSVNPSQADGLAACTNQEIGYLPEKEGVHFSKEAPTCPDASKLGSLEVTTPLLAEYEDEGTRLATDPETGKAIPRPLHGSVYLAEPNKNPLGSLLAIYLSVEDPKSGTYAKLAGEVVPDPVTGQLTTVFEENPQLPLEDVRLHLFGGARGSLITPLACGTHTTTSTLTPWSSPEGADAHPSDAFQTTAAPGGGSCPATEAAAPNSPTFSAGTLSPQAGAFSPFVLKLSREDGSQRLAGLDTTLPRGLTGKLAGIAECSESQIAQAQSRSHPEEGRLERESPSCPGSSEVGTVTVGAGAGPNPFYVNGHAYLAGPYNGAPLSLAIVTPAVAGPFDLGTVVTRVALHVEPETAQIHAVSDPFPQILDGIPLDVRSVALKMDRPQFILNPTSCDPMAITGQATSALSQAASLSERFQVGGCSSLAFKPKLSLALKGSVKRSSNPRLIANLTARPGEANIARAQVKLPHAVFLDQAHIRTVCTRVQFAADACPPGSIYGRATATTPLLDYPLSGPVYLRSSSHQLPDLVVKLKGPASQPIEIDLAGKTDAVKAALRNTFEAVPDQPVSRFHLELFGGRRGLVEMSGGFCAHRKANVQLTGQNGKAHDTRPVVGAKCPKQHKHGHRRRGGGER